MRSAGALARRAGVRRSRVLPTTSAALRRGVSSGPVDLAALRLAKHEEMAGLPEAQQLARFTAQLRDGACTPAPGGVVCTHEEAGLDAASVVQLLDAAFMTFTLHVEARIASALGQGFYTIGPCGEELLSAIGSVLRPTDVTALHYRHVAAQLSRQLCEGKTPEEILLDRARGFTVSALDPVAGGVHCSIGGGSHDFIVTSTLASQAPPAVGRAMAAGLAKRLRQPSLLPADGVSFVSVGDGSVNNAHFLAAVNMAQYAQHRQFPCPVVFAVSDNDACISLKGYGWLPQFAQRSGLRVFEAHGDSLPDVHRATEQAVAHARSTKGPVMVVYKNLPRRFGHAATDRQDAYLSHAHIQATLESNPLEHACWQAVHEGLVTYPQLAARLDALSSATAEAFDAAACEPKLDSRDDMIARNSAPLRPAPTRPAPSAENAAAGTAPRKPKRDVMRKHMTAVIQETLELHENCVYIGEDVEHGGYYRVTDGLANKFKHRVRDFPPDETSLVGAAMGFSQMGLFPIVEIPYAKYLDCGADMFFEAAIANWGSNGQRPNGMIVRLQGFDKGVFGGNFHTHNSIHCPPGVDVVCYSNGRDYARGWRYAVEQARGGRMVMSVDSTALLNLRHVVGSDDAWRQEFPAAADTDVITFDDVMVYGGARDTVPLPSVHGGASGEHDEEYADHVAIVTYGNGVVTALQAQRELEQKHGVRDVVVVDSPYLSDVPAGLRVVLRGARAVVFADPCKGGSAGGAPLAGTACAMHSEGLLPGGAWSLVAAPRTYNPLGKTFTFLDQADIVELTRKTLAMMESEQRPETKHTKKKKKKD